MRTVAVALFAALPSCLDPLVADEVMRPDSILPSGTVVPNLADDEDDRAELEEYAGVEGTVIPLHSAFAGGERIWYWDFGAASPAPIPLYLLVQDTEQGGQFEAHGEQYAKIPGNPPIFDAIPGDYAYSPWWRVVIVPVTDAYHGEVITSFKAIDEAYRQGLVEEPIPLTKTINCPVVLPETRLETVPGDTATLKAPYRAYYRGRVVHYFSFSELPVDGLRVGVPPAYMLRREGGEPLSEAQRGVDMTGDGDRLDSNDLFAAKPGDPDYTDMVELIEAVVVDGKYIDESRSDAESDLDDAAQLFSGDVPDPSRVVALHPLGLVLNRPIRPPPEETP